MSTAILGGGRMAVALHAAFRRAGGAAELIDPRDPDPTALKRAPVLLLAVPFAAALDLIRRPLAACADGRVLVDVTNPATWPATPIPQGASGGEVLAAAAPGWRVVKALNTIPARMLQVHQLSGMPVSVPVAGADPAAKAQVSELIRGLGFAPVDAGGISASREIEALAVLLMRISDRNGLHGEIGIHIGRPAARTSLRRSVS
ncbi:NADP oxidoreductase [Actinoplanes sp. LDG1-06]|uniref:NADP oxidoreductase n=1 Tax=Paractinoplanes ovalisporus TaxID=2810368 RepID=A0ABS2A4K5_9ACTN|nr:NADP oxidoreductase [Actinoplanes ovalisporus]MBM2614213.1 NADP oxidoreductase [Actinoplanes ovalisporus]